MRVDFVKDYTIPSDNWEQQHTIMCRRVYLIIPYQAITGNNNAKEIIEAGF